MGRGGEGEGAGREEFFQYMYSEFNCRLCHQFYVDARFAFGNAVRKILSMWTRGFFNGCSFVYICGSCVYVGIMCMYTTYLEFGISAKNL